MKENKTFILVSCACIALTLSGIIAADSVMRFRSDQARLYPEQAEQGARPPGVEQSARAGGFASEAFAWFSKQKGVRVLLLDALSTPRELSLSAGISEQAFSRLLETFLKKSAGRLLSYSWSQDGGALSFTMALGRGREELTLALRLYESADIPARPPQQDKQNAITAYAQEAADRFRGARVALILDDAGWGIPPQGAGAPEEGPWAFLRLPAKLTFAVIPKLAGARRFSEDAHAAGHEVIIHLPMQPMANERQFWGGDMLSPDMKAWEIDRILSEALQSIPGARGVNNHMGSLATTDRAFMRLFMPLLKARGLFFVDSFTHADSVALDEAVQAGMPARRRDVFIDHVAEPAYIENALRDLVQAAAVRGTAIGIGHVTHPETLRVLRDQLPAYSAQGVRFVGISEIP